MYILFNLFVGSSKIEEYYYELPQKHITWQPLNLLQSTTFTTDLAHFLPVLTERTLRPLWDSQLISLKSLDATSYTANYLDRSPVVLKILTSISDSKKHFIEEQVNNETVGFYEVTVIQKHLLKVSWFCLIGSANDLHKCERMRVNFEKMRKLAEGLFLAEEYKIYGHQLIEEYQDEEVEDDLVSIKKGQGIQREEEEEEEKNIQEESKEEVIEITQDERETKELIDKLG